MKKLLIGLFILCSLNSFSQTGQKYIISGGSSTDTTSLSNRINLKANIASPTFTGTVIIPTLKLPTLSSGVTSTDSLMVWRSSDSSVRKLNASAISATDTTKVSKEASKPTLGSVFNNTGAFSSGNYTQGGTTFTVNASTISGNSGGVAGTYTNYIQYNYTTLLQNYVMEATYTLGTVGASSTGLGFGIKSTGIGYTNGYIIVLDCSNGANAGKILGYSVVNGVPTLSATSTGSVAPATGDQIKMKLISGRGKTIIEFYNITQNKTVSTASLQSLYYAAGPTDLLFNSGSNYNIGKFTIYNFGFQGSISTFKVTSNEIKNADYLCIGDSQTKGAHTITTDETWTQRLAKDLNVDVVVQAGPSITSADYLTVITETVALTPKTVIILLGTNDIGGIGSQTITTLETNLPTIITTLQAAGIQVYVCELLPRNLSGIGTYNTWLRANYSSLVIPTFQAFTDGSANGSMPANYSSDNLHPNTMGHYLLASVIESALLPQYDKRVAANPPSFPASTLGNNIGRDLTLGTLDNYNVRLFAGTNKIYMNTYDATMTAGLNIVGSATGTSGIASLFAKNTSSTGRSSVQLIDNGGTISGYMILNNTSKQLAVGADGGAASLALQSYNNMIVQLGNSYTQTANWTTAGLFIGGSTTPTAKLHLAAGTATASTAPLKFTTASSVLLTTTETGVMEVDTAQLYYTAGIGLDLKRATVSQWGYTGVSATYTALARDYTIDCTSGTFTVSLPTAVGIAGRVYVIKNSGAGTITIDPNASETIDGSTTKVFNTQYAGCTIQSDNTNWKIISTF